MLLGVLPLLLLACGGGVETTPAIPADGGGMTDREAGAAVEASSPVEAGLPDAGGTVDANDGGPTLCCQVGQSLEPCGDPDAGFAVCEPLSITHQAACVGALGRGVTVVCGP